MEPNPPETCKAYITSGPPELHDFNANPVVSETTENITTEADWFQALQNDCLGNSLSCCNECQRLFPSVYSLDHHNRKQHKDLLREYIDNGLYCHFCTIDVLTKERLAIHLFIHREAGRIIDGEVYDNKNIRECLICACSFSSSKLYLRHMSECLEKLRKDCRRSNVSFDKEISRRNNVTCTEKTKPENKTQKDNLKISDLDCNMCEYKTTNPIYLKRHMVTHTKEMLFKCDMCDYGTNRKARLVYHIRAHTGVRPYGCNMCEYRTTKPEYLKEHSLTHTKEKRYKCKLCEYSCAQNQNLKSHMATHTKEKPFTCDKCGLKFKLKSALKTHQRLHTGIKSYKCNLCDRSFARSDNLKQHVKRVHEAEKRFKCNLCDFEAAKSYGLKIHMTTHPMTKIT